MLEVRAGLSFQSLRIGATLLGSRFLDRVRQLQDMASKSVVIFVISLTAIVQGMGKGLR